VCSSIYAFPLAFIIGQGLYIAPHLKGDTAQPEQDNTAP
jgi:hypothetical protein